MATTKKATTKKTTVRRTTARKVAPAKRVVKKTTTTTTMTTVVQPQKNRMIGLFESIRNFIRGYFDFLGRSTRSEFWFGFLFAFVVNFVVYALFGSGMVFSIVNILFFIPFIALTTRRFHDAGLSVWWYMIPCLLFYLIPVFRAAAWARFMAFNMVSLDMVIYSFFSIAFWVFCVVVACLPTRK